METTIIETDSQLLLWQLFITVLLIFDNILDFYSICHYKNVAFHKKVSHYIDLKTAYLKSRKQEL